MAMKKNSDFEDEKDDKKNEIIWKWADSKWAFVGAQRKSEDEQIDEG